MACSSGANSGTSTTATFARQLASSADDTRATAVTLRRPAIMMRRQDGSEASPPPPNSAGARAFGTEGGEGTPRQPLMLHIGQVGSRQGVLRKLPCGADGGDPNTVARPQPFVGLHTPYGAKLAGFDRCGSAEEGASQTAGGNEWARPRDCLPDDSLLNLCDGDI